MAAQDNSTPYAFYLDDEEISENLQTTITTKQVDTESVVEIVYQPQAIFRVKSVTRCSSTLPGTLCMKYELCKWRMLD